MKKEIVCVVLMAVLLASMFSVLPVQPVKSSATPLFSMTLVAPGNANLLRRQWALIIANDFEQAGIDARVVFLGWGSVYDRILTPSAANVGKDWNDGGYDALFIGWTPGNPNYPFFGDYQIYYGANSPPGNNYMLWNNATADSYIASALANGYNAAGDQAFENWQLVQYQDVPASQIILTSNVMSAASSINFHGFEWIFDNLGPVTQFLSGPSSVVLATTGSLLNLNAPLSSSWYDTEVFSNIYDALYAANTNLQYVPDLATADPVTSNNAHTFTYTLRQGVQWQDGINFTADDVLFSFLAYLNPNSGSQYSALYSGYMGNDVNFTWVNGTTTTLLIDTVNGVGYYPANASMMAQFAASNTTRLGSVVALSPYSVQVNIPNFIGTSAPAATFHPDVDTIVMLPLHVFDGIDPSQWSQMVFNLANGQYTSNGQTFNGPIGTGPYKFVSYDATSGLVTETKNMNYWNRTGLESQGMFNIQNFYVRYITDKDGAIASLKNNEVQILDAQYSLNNDYTAGNLNFATNYILNGSGLQQLGYNMRDAIWGTGTATPLGQSNPAQAAAAARDVRLAFDWLIPRQEICTDLLGGLAQPAAVHLASSSAIFNTACVPRDLNVTMALAYLAAAGYNTGVAPIGGGGGGGGGGTGINTATLSNPFTTLPVLLTDQQQPLVFKGSFSVAQSDITAHHGVMIVLESSLDGITWTGVALENSTDGSYSFAITPTSYQTIMYHVVMTGIGADTAASEGFTTATFPYVTLPTSDSFTSIQITDPVTYYSVGYALSQLQSQTNSSYNNLVAFLNSSFTTLNSQLASQSNQITTLNGQLVNTNSQISSLNTTVSNLNSQVGNLQTYMYIAIVVAIIAILIAIVAVLRKR